MKKVLATQATAEILKRGLDKRNNIGTTLRRGMSKEQMRNALFAAQERAKAKATV